MGIQNLGFGFLGHHTADDTIELVKTAERLGFTNAWIAEDYFYAGAFSIASACASHTSEIQLGIGVINPYTRHPVLAAMEAASLDSISKGRAIIALGASNKRWMEIEMGIPYEKPITATKECAQIMKKLVAEGRVDFKGSVFQTGPLDLSFEPYRKELPVYLGVKGDKALEITGQVADGILISAGCTLEYIQYAKDKIAKGAESAGRNPEDIRVAAYLPTCICEDGQEAVEMMRPFVRRYLGLHGAQPILTCGGFDPDELAPFREAFLAGKQCENEVTDEMVKKIVVAGTKKECRERIEAYVDAGVEMPICFEIGGSVNPMDTLHVLHDALLD